MLLSFLILEPVGAVYPRKLWINPISPTLQLDFSAELDMSGGFAVEEGEYQVEVLVTGNRNRFCRKRWTIQAERSHGQSDIPVT